MENHCRNHAEHPRFHTIVICLPQYSTLLCGASTQPTCATIHRGARGNGTVIYSSQSIRKSSTWRMSLFTGFSTLLRSSQEDASSRVPEVEAITTGSHIHQQIMIRVSALSAHPPKPCGHALRLTHEFNGGSVPSLPVNVSSGIDFAFGTAFASLQP